MSDTELRYAQIEKKALATTWACDKFKDFLIGKHFCIETDHKPLVPLLSSKYLDNLPPRILRFRLRLMRFSYTVTRVPEIPNNSEPNEEQTPQDLQPSLPQPEPETQAQPKAPRSPIATLSRTGTAIKPPLCYGREDVMGLDVT